MQFCFFILSFVCIFFVSCESFPLKKSKSDGESFIKNDEEFIPSHQWQIVKEGQAIPPGLHVRLNLQTGLREAKLLEDEPSKVSNELTIVEEPNEKKSKENLQRAFEKLDLTRDDVQTDPKHIEEIRQKYRSYDQLKKDFQEMNMNIQTDQEILTGLVKKLEKTSDQDELKIILTDLEYYLHQYDNAVLFSDLHGLEILLTRLNSTQISSDISQLIILTLGAAFQGNPAVQSKGLNLGFVQFFLHRLNVEENFNTKLKLIFGLSTLLRNFPLAQREFRSHGGVESLIKVFDSILLDPQQQEKIRSKIIQLFNDLIIEKSEIHRSFDLRQDLFEHRWCSRLSNHLITIDSSNLDQIEKTLDALIPFTDVCRLDLVSLQSKFNQLNDVYGKVRPDDSSTYSEILTLLKKLQNSSSSLSSNDL